MDGKECEGEERYRDQNGVRRRIWISEGYGYELRYG